MEASRTSPAKTFPKSRKESDATFAISPISSKIPTKNAIGETIMTLLSLRNLVTIPPSALILTYLLKIFQAPIIMIPKILEPMTMARLNAKVVLISAVPARKMGIKTECPASFAKKPIDPTKGRRPSQLFTKIKINKDATKGKILSVILRSFVTWSHRDNAPSIKISKMC